MKEIKNNRTDSYPYSDNRKNGRRNDRGCSSYHRRTGKRYVYQGAGESSRPSSDQKVEKEGYLITGTAIYTELQGYLAINNGADYIAPYYNRMQNQGIDAMKVIDSLRTEIERTQRPTKILAASFKIVNKSLQPFDLELMR